MVSIDGEQIKFSDKKGCGIFGVDEGGNFGTDKNQRNQG